MSRLRILRMDSFRNMLAIGCVLDDAWLAVRENESQKVIYREAIKENGRTHLGACVICFEHGDSMGLK